MTYGIATAYHVIAHAYEWEEPIKLIHAETGRQIVLRVSDRFILANPLRDAAVIVLFNQDTAYPREELSLVPEDKHLKPGIPLGWVGYPAVAPDDLSFFSGSVSCFLGSQLAYLVDGVAINGVSGGPAFSVISGEEIDLVGVVSAYIPNRATGENLPGVCFVVGMHSFYDSIKTIKSVEDARLKAVEMKAEQDVVQTPKYPPGLLRP